jgi:hypothetical protein
MKSRLWSSIFASLFVFAFTISTTAFGQVSINGSLRGRINDTGNASVAGASVKLTNAATATTQRTTSDGDGDYQFARLAPGVYSLTIEKEGFKRAQRDNIVIAVNDNAVVDATLAIGALSETVTVEGGAALLQSQSVEISGLVNERRVKELPLNGRDFQKLVLLAPGVGGVSGTTPNNPAISGARPVNNTYTIDGIGSNDERLAVGFAGLSNDSGTDLGESVPNMISTEAIQEFRIISSNADATFGRASGGQINIVTKSGGNRLHGSAYEYLRNDALDARDFFNNTGPFLDSRGRAKTPPFKQNLFGGTLGGKIYPDRHFFFGSYEGLIQRRREQSSVTTAVPNSDLIRFVPGDLGRYLRTYFIDRGIIPATGNPAGVFSPLPTADRAAARSAGFTEAFFDGDPANGEAGTVQISTAPPRNIDQHGFLVRTDHRLSERLNVSARYAFAQSETLAGSSAIAVNLQEGQRRYQAATAQAIYTLTPAQILEVRGGFLRNRFEQLAVGGEIDPRLTALGISPEFGISVSAGSLFDASLISAFIDNQTTPQGSALHTWTHGSLTLRSGADLRLVMLNVANISSGTPAYTFNASPVGSNGIFGVGPNSTQATSVNARLSAYGLTTGPKTPMRGYRSLQQEYFAQSDWRVGRDLTLNFGLRYSIFGVYDEVNGTIANLYATDLSGRTIPDGNAISLGRSANSLQLIADGRPFYQSDYNNLQPRLGVAWDIGGRGRTVARAAYGVYYDRVTQLQFTGIVTNVPYAISSNTANVPFLLGATVPITAAANPAVTIVNPELRNPRTQRWNLAIEQQIGKDTSVTAAYVGARGDDLFGQTQINGFGGVPQTLRPDPRFSTQQLIDNLGQSRYHSLQISAKRRFGRGMDFTLAYTFAQSRDTTSRGTFGNVPTLINLGASAATGFQGGGAEFASRPLSADWGLSEFDVRHNLTISHLIELPFGKGRRLLGGADGFVNALIGGWSLAGLAVARSGEPFNVVRGIDYNDDGDAANDRPALISGKLGELYANESLSRTQYLLPQTDALARLNTPSNVADPFAVIARNAFRAPRIAYYDLSLIKQFQITENMRLGFEANAFNLFNRANFSAPNANLTSALFGRITGSRIGTNPRQIQFGLKLNF